MTDEKKGKKRAIMIGGGLTLAVVGVASYMLEGMLRHITSTGVDKPKPGGVVLAEKLGLVKLAERYFARKDEPAPE
jgi:hypothetical protein